MLFDIVIPVGPNDVDIIGLQLRYTKSNIIGYRNIYIVCEQTDDKIDIINNITKIDDNIIIINERIFPFTIETVSLIHGKSQRNGWYLQQLLKMYAGKVIPNILERYLVIDSDTFFMKPTEFIQNNKCLYNWGFENHGPFFQHMKRLDTDFNKVSRFSGICHHMMFETIYIGEIINKVELNHNDPFYITFLKQVAFDKETSGASEYEIYFNYMLKNHPSKITLRELKWKNVDRLLYDTSLDYISYHWWRRS